MAITSNSKITVNKAQLSFVQQPFSQKLDDFWHSPSSALMGVIAAILIFLIDGYAILIGSIAIPLLIANLYTPRRMPLKMPKSSGAKWDSGSLRAGTENETTEAQGITCIGKDRETGKQVWEDADNDKRHYCIIATTGSGKSFGLRFQLMMSLVQTGGTIAIDGKGDIALPLDSYSLIRRFCREDDLRILNFKQGNKNIYAANGTPRTNSFNPFSTGSSTYIAEVLKALLSTDNGGKGGDMWKQRAEAMCDNIAKMATYKRDHSDFKIRPQTIAEMLELRELCRIYADENIPEEYKGALKNYFITLPTFEVENAKAYANGEEFGSKCLEQHGYVSMQLQPALQVLSDQYGFIFDVDTPEIDMKDIVINNRILLVLLPAMEQSEGTLRNTGKIILAALKGMIAGELGDKFEGNVKEILSERACADESVFKCNFDEAGYYAAISGIEILPAQGRGLGFSFSFICQSYTDLEKGGKETADIIWGNCNNKMIGKAETDTTYAKINARLGKETVLAANGYNLEAGEFTTGKRVQDSIATQEVDRLTMRDLAKLREGQYYYVTNDKLISLQMGDPQIKNKCEETRYNQLVALNPIPEKTQKALRISYTKMIDFFKSNISGQKVPFRFDDFPLLRSSINSRLDKESTDGASKSASIHDWQIALYTTITGLIETKNADNKAGVEGVMDTLFGNGLVPRTQQQTESAASTAKQAAPEAPAPALTENDMAAMTADSLEVSDWGAMASNAYDELSGGAKVYDDSYGMKHITAYETEVEHLKMLYESGQYTEEEYEAEILLLNEDYKNAIEGRDEGDDQDSDDDHDELLNLKPDPDSVILEESAERDYLFNPEVDKNNYPSSQARGMANKTLRSRMSNVLKQVEDTYQIDI